MKDNKKTILVVEDEVQMLELLRTRLEANGYNIITATTGESAYDTYLKESPDLIVLDINIPTFNGYEVCRKIKRENDDNSTPVLMLTAKAQESDRIVGKVIGAECYMTKPFDPTELLDKIKELLRDAI
ncbi:MAG: response regulator [Candidatus Zapsychrus exili]|nr:response regulator [Candidatus Zapsychrus exili]